MSKKIYIVVPCYNEQEVLHETYKQLKEKMNDLIEKNTITSDSRVMFVDDGSKDRTWEIIEELNKEDNMFGGIKLSRNRGHQNALLAGLMTCKDECDAIISMDADLQDDIGVVDQFIDKFANEECEIVYGVRSSREKDTFFKRETALFFYRLMDKLGVDVVYNHADYRLMSSRALNALASYKEVNLFLRGMVPLIGYKSDVVKYERNERFAGESKYPLKKMLAFAFEGITSLSVKPIRMVTSLGVIVFLASLIYIIYALIRWGIGETVTGWTTIIASIWALGGIQILCIGIIGEYVGKTYLEVKERPKFIVDKKL
ncbi:glycosyltransferase family 2 protein [uncultured Clostridium sp.]|uniref:glycosyltransferase family 2 protein n=1 Tax=uncultured Clostridium sp. TaxID=59620 RepID=UPI0026103912|nr:glycosyltransferase family 2 protein [uncultured Clostridium sp.]